MRRLVQTMGFATVCGLLVAWALSLNTPAQAQTFRGEPFRCTVVTSTATSITAVGGDCAAQVGVALYITDIYFSASAAGIAADAFPTLKYGTGTTCGTGTTVFWGALTAAAITVPETFTTPIRLPPNVDVCWISSTAGSKFLVIAGYKGQ